MFDYTKTPDQLLIDLINEDNNTNLLPNLVVFSEPVVEETEGATKNTRINISAAVGSGYNDAVDLTYDRVPLGGFVGTIELVFLAEDPQNTTLVSLIPNLNTMLNINLTVDDFVDGPLPTFTDVPNQIIQVLVAATATSLVYIGDLSIGITNGGIDLSQVLTVTDLEGFTIDPSQVVQVMPDIGTVFATNVLPGF